VICFAYFVLTQVGLGLGAGGYIPPALAAWSPNAFFALAGIILTIGMAVDSNVLIFERIREELRSGKTIASSVEQGFGRAFVTIIDTHVTTIVSSLQPNRAATSARRSVPDG